MNGPGAHYLENGRCLFTVWAPRHDEVHVHLLSPNERLVSLEKASHGYHRAEIEDIPPGTRYLYRFSNGQEFPDPASRHQPEGVHGPSQVVSDDFSWEDDCWFGIPLERYILYELHVGTFSREGTFDSVIPHLEDLKDLGVTAVEIMPIAQFPGNRNWGYDGVYPFAAQNSYGGPEGFKRFVDACHQNDLAVVLDVVYNHLGPEGNYLGQFGSYFSERYQTPWGPAINFDGAGSDQVKEYFIESALYWVTECHVDALRIDAVHAILDLSAIPFLEALAIAVDQRSKKLNRQIFLIPESALNDPKIVRSRDVGGYGLHAQWNDDFHHALHVLLTRERDGYYQDFENLDHFVKAVREGFVYSGQYSHYRQRSHGRSSSQIPADRFVVFSQNHDQVGNRARGDRLSRLVSFEALKLAAGAVILSPFIPLLFMGEEYGEEAPFPFFVSFSDPELIEAVREGRRQEFAAFDWKGELPDPQSEQTFQDARLDHSLKNRGKHERLHAFYKHLIELRKKLPALSAPTKEGLIAETRAGGRLLLLSRRKDSEHVLMLFNFQRQPVCASMVFFRGRWTCELDSSDQQWGGSGSLMSPSFFSEGEVEIELNPQSFVLLSHQP